MIVVGFIAIVLGTLAALLFGVSALQRSGHLGPEGGRKLVHFGMGLIGLSLPFFFHDARPIWLLALLGGGVVAAVRFIPAAARKLGGVLGGVGRISFGDLYFPLAVALAFTLTHGDPVLYCGAIGVLVFADTAGALVGVRWGRIHYSLLGNRKSLEGSVAVWLVSAVWITLVEAILGQSAWPAVLLGGLLAGITALVIEGVSGYGLDNLLLPIAVLELMAIWDNPSANQTVVRQTCVGAVALSFVIFAVAAGISARRNWRRASPNVASS